MKIAVTYNNGTIFQHFGHTKQFKIYETENGKVISSAVVNSDGFGHGALATFLKNNSVELLICGGIGGGAQTALANAGIELRGGVSGNCDEAVNSYLCGTLEYNPNVKCNSHSHGEGGHNCGDNHHCSGGGCH